MEKLNRNSRVVAITKILTENPNKIIGLSQFASLLNAAKSTISEDIVIVREILEKLELGSVETIAGATGGIRYVHKISNNNGIKFAEELCTLIKDSKRVIAGNFIYMTDVMYNPDIISKAGVILSSCFEKEDID